jgi:ElaB/YqjD/DUF883 family membrane-anchored ribosome-binding protein
MLSKTYAALGRAARLLLTVKHHLKERLMSGELDDLFSEITALLERVGDVATSPEVARLRRNVEKSLRTAQESLTRRATKATRSRPLLALGVAAAVGLGVGLLLTRSSD